jgi:hypothetical protein
MQSLGRSQLPMQARREDGYRAARAVESRVCDKLVVQGAMEPLGELAIVVHFHDFLRAVAQSTVAVENTQATGLQEQPVPPINPAPHTGQADCILWTPPSRTLDAGAERRRGIGVRKHPGFVLPVIPAEARKHADVLANLLLRVQPKAVRMA